MLILLIQLTKKVKVNDRRKRRQEDEGASEDLEGDNDLINMDQNAQLGGVDQEQLTQEEKDEQIIKTLNTNNPQAPHNLTKFSYKDHLFKTDEFVEQLVFHFSFDGDIILKDSDEARD